MNVGKKFDLHHVAPVVEKCFDECATAAVIKAAFEKTGVYKLNRNIFTDDDFLAARLIAEAEARAENAEGEPIDDRVLLVMEEDIPAGSFEEVASTSGTSSLFENLNASGPIRIGQIAKKSNRGPKAMQSCVLTSPEMRTKLQTSAEKRAINKRKKDEKSQRPTKRIKGETSQAPATKKNSEKKKAPASKTAPSKKNSPAKKSTRKKRVICTECSKEIEGPITEFNATECNTCHQPFHLACIHFTASYFTCANCDSDFDE